MTPRFAATALFASDIREENGGSMTVVGIMPDNLLLEQIPATMPQLAIYIRANMAAEHPVRELRFSFRRPDQTDVFSQAVDPAVMNKSRDDALTDGAPVFGIVQRLVLTPFPVLQPGRYTVYAHYGDEEYLIGHSSMATELPPSARQMQ